MNDIRQTQTKVASSLRKHTVAICGLLIASLFISQFVVLATLGTKGGEVSRVRNEKDEIRINNERIRAEIDNAKTLSNIENGLDTLFNLQNTNVKSVPIAAGAISEVDSLGAILNEE